MHRRPAPGTAEWRWVFADVQLGAEPFLSPSLAISYIDSMEVPKAKRNRTTSVTSPAAARSLAPAQEDIWALYAILASRRIAYDSMMWQTPALGLTAQAFLLTIALSSGNSVAGRRIAALLALVVALISMQLMAKHRKLELIDSRFLERIERDALVLCSVLGVVPHSKPESRAPHADVVLRWWDRKSSYAIWMGGLAMFGAAALATFFITFVGRPLL